MKTQPVSSAKTIVAPIAVALLLMAGGLAHSAPVVLYDSTQDYTGGTNRSLQGGAPNISSSELTTAATGPINRSIAFQTTTALSPSIGYTGPTFYGGWNFEFTTVAITANATNAYTSLARVDGAAGANVARLNEFKPAGSAGNGTYTGFARSAFVFDLGGSVEVASASLATAGGNWGAKNVNARFLVRSGGLWYLSDTTTTTNLSLNFTSTSQWSLFNTSNMTVGAAQGNRPFTTIDYLGIYGAVENGSVSVGNGSYTFGSLGMSSLSYTAVPEPGTAALLGLAATACLLFRRRRHPML